MIASIAVEEPPTVLMAVLEAATAFIAVLEAAMLFIAVESPANSFIKVELETISLNTDVHFVPVAEAKLDPS